MSPKDLLLALVVIIAWGLNFVVIKVGLDGLPPMLLRARLVMDLDPGGATRPCKGVPGGTTMTVGRLMRFSRGKRGKAPMMP